MKIDILRTINDKVFTPMNKTDFNRLVELIEMPRIEGYVKSINDELINIIVDDVIGDRQLHPVEADLEAFLPTRQRVVDFIRQWGKPITYVEVIRESRIEECMSFEVGGKQIRYSNHIPMSEIDDREALEDFIETSAEDHFDFEEYEKNYQDCTTSVDTGVSLDIPEVDWYEFNPIRFETNPFSSEGLSYAK